jgi:hypothetical protein
MSMSWLIGMHVQMIRYVSMMNQGKEERKALMHGYALMKNEDKIGKCVCIA